MKITFDSTKSASNEVVRGLPFDLAENFDWSTAVIVEDTREDYGERRFQAVGYLDAHLCMLVFTPRGDAVHIISLRRANHRERTRYAKS